MSTLFSLSFFNKENNTYFEVCQNGQMSYDMFCTQDDAQLMVGS